MDTSVLVAWEFQQNNYLLSSNVQHHPIKIEFTCCVVLEFTFLLQSVLQASSNIVDYKFDTKKEEWCEVTIKVCN